MRSNLIINNPSINFTVSEMPWSFLVSFPSTKNRKTALRHLYHESSSTTHTPPSPEKFPPNTPGLIRNGEKVRNMSHPHVPHFLKIGVRCQPLIISRNLLICQLVEELVIDLSIGNEVHLPSRSILPSNHATGWEMRQQPQKCGSPCIFKKKVVYE